ncbi:MAG: MATE family efflux transporter [Pseudomonadales bacterium]|nr:MATE family efflux transporter [Pseudomonadales bacterium]
MDEASTLRRTLSALRDARPAPADRDRVWSLAWPMILSNISVPLLGLVDTAVLGHLPGPTYLAAVAVGTTLFGFLYWGFGFLRMGTTGLVAQRFGQPGSGARDAALRLLLAQGGLLALAIGLAVIAASPLLLDLGIRLLAPPDAVGQEAIRYTSIRVFSAPAVLATYACTGFLVGMQDTRSVLLIMVTTNLINIALDLFLVLGLGMRTAGVAGATLASEYLGLLLAVGFSLRRLGAHPAVLDRAALLRPSAYAALIAVNGHLFLRTLCLLGAMSFFTAQGARQGEVTLAANALLLSMLMLVAHGLDGFAHAAEALVGRSLGAGDRGALLRTIRATGAFSVLTALAFTALFAVAGPGFVSLLTDLPEVGDQARHHLPWLVALPLIAVWCFLLDGIFIGATRTRAMRDTMLIATFGVFLPLWWVTRPLGNSGLWLSFDAFFLARGAALGLRFLRTLPEWIPPRTGPADTVTRAAKGSAPV